MTQLLFQTDSYLKHFTARVIETRPAESSLAPDRTAFYAGGGGQPADTGIIRWENYSAAVQKVLKIGERVWHRLEGELPPPGTEITGEIDWDRRYRLMRTHTALHILCGVVWRDYGAQVTGGNMEPLKGRMDFEFESLQQELVHEIEAKINREVKNARPITVQILPREEAFRIPDLIRTKINLLPEGIREVRTVEIEGLDLQADGGTHVANTREVGRVRVTGYKSKGKMNKRLYIELDDAAG